MAILALVLSVVITAEVIRHPSAPRSIQSENELNHQGELDRRLRQPLVFRSGEFQTAFHQLLRETQANAVVDWWLLSTARAMPERTRPVTTVIPSPKLGDASWNLIKVAQDEPGLEYSSEPAITDQLDESIIMIGNDELLQHLLCAYDVRDLLGGTPVPGTPVWREGDKLARLADQSLPEEVRNQGLIRHWSGRIIVLNSANAQRQFRSFLQSLYSRQMQRRSAGPNGDTARSTYR